MEATAVFDTKPLLRPAQVEDAKSEIKALEAQMQSPHVEDKSEVQKKLMRTKRTFEEQIPKPPTSGDEEGRMVSREKQLLGEILSGMPSQAEMRRAPPGAVDKHMAWEKRNKLKIAEWKNLRLRLNPGEREAANLERHRPVGGSLNLDNAHITGKQIYIPDQVGNTVTFNDSQIAVLRMVSPQLADALSLMTNPERAQVKAAVEGIGLAEPSKASLDGSKGAEKREKRKRVLSPEHLAKLQAGRRAKKAA